MASMIAQSTSAPRRNEGESYKHLGKHPSLVAKLRMEWIEAVRNNNMEKIELFLTDQHLPLYWTNNNGQIAAHIAIKKNNMDLLEYLLKKDIAAQVGAEDNKQLTPLHLAASQGRLKIVQFFIEKCHLPANLVNSQDASLVYKSAAQGRYKTVVYLMKCGADVKHSTSSNDTPLHAAVRKNHSLIVRYLVEMGNVDVNVRNAMGDTPLHEAVEAKNYKTAKYLIEKCNASPFVENANRKTPFHIAVSQRQERIAKYITRIFNVGCYHNLVGRFIDENSEDVQQEEDVDKRQFTKELEKIRPKKRKAIYKKTEQQKQQDSVADHQVERGDKFERYLRNLEAMIQSRKNEERNNISNGGKLFSAECSHVIEPQAGPSHAM